MKVWVIASDIGLNGIWIHGVRSTEPTGAEISKFVTAIHHNPDGSPYRIASTTGYGHTDAWEMEVDGEWE